MNTYRFALGALSLLILSVAFPAAAQEAQPPAMPPSKLVEDGSAPNGWGKYIVGAEPLFSVLLPMKHEASAQHSPTPSGIPYTAYLYTGTTDMGVYLVTMTVFTAPIESQSEQRRHVLYESFSNGLFVGMQSDIEKGGVKYKVTPGELKKRTISGLDGREQDFTFGSLQGHVRFVLAGQRIYAAMAMYDPGKHPGERIAFFGSFAIMTQN